MGGGSGEPVTTTARQASESTRRTVRARDGMEMDLIRETTVPEGTNNPKV
jgi:hypothetical protein